MKTLFSICVLVLGLALAWPGRSHAATPLPVVRNSFTTNPAVSTMFSIGLPSGTRTNANAAMAYGGIQLSTAVYGQSAVGNYNYRNGVEFWGPGWDGTIRDYSDLANHPTAFIHSLTNWGGSLTANGAVLHIASAGNIRLEPNYGEPWYGQNYLSLGNEDGNAPVIVNDCAFSITNGANGFGYSLPLNFSAKGVVGGNTYTARPGIMGWFGGTNTGLSTYDGLVGGVLSFYSRTPTADRSYRTFGTDDPTTPIEVGRTSTNGWRFFGPVNLQQSTTYAVGTNVFLDFNGPSSQTIYLQSGVLTNFLKLTNVNVYRGSTNFEQRTFRLIAGGLDRPIRYPAWSVVSETGSTAPSSLLAAQKVMILRLTAWGDGDTNVVAEFGTGTDATWAFDADAAAFFTAASISDATQKGAVDTMVKALKGLNLYTNFVALWPMVGGNASAHALNLINTSLYPWTWVGTPTQDANGVTGNGSSMYGTTTFNWSTHMGGQALTNFHAAVYVRTTTPTDGGAFIGGRNAGSVGVGITRESASAGVRGAMNTLGPNAIVNLSTDLRGPIILSRANNFAEFDMATRLTTITTTTSDAVSVPSISPYLLAYNYNASASSFSSANIAFASVGWGFTTNQLNQVEAIIENFEAALSRKAP